MPPAAGSNPLKPLLAMKSFLLGLALVLAPVAAQVVQPTPAPAPVEAAPLDEAQLRQLLGPIALYPDALIALILPASTEPAEVVMAARHLAAGSTAESINAQTWSESVKGLARYPDVLAWMDTNLAWTRQLGDAFVAQPAEVMNALQVLRAQARAAGTLTDTAEQRVVVQENVIRIEPARVDVIHVPRYDPAVVYVVGRPQPWRGPCVTFGRPYPTGIWLVYACDWRQRVVLVVAPHYRPYHHGHSYTVVYNHGRPSSGYHCWTPPAHRSRVQVNSPGRAGTIVYDSRTGQPRQDVPAARPAPFFRKPVMATPAAVRPQIQVAQPAPFATVPRVPVSATPAARPSEVRRPAPETVGREPSQRAASLDQRLLSPAGTGGGVFSPDNPNGVGRTSVFRR